MSRLPMWLISCPMTPWSCSRSSLSSRPVVTATLACFGSRPVANAFGAESSMTHSRGGGRPPARRISSTTLTSCPNGSGWVRAVDLARAAGRHHERVAGEAGADAHATAITSASTSPPQPKPVA